MAPPTPLPPVVPGASFYVDQHVSQGAFGRDSSSSAAPDLLVYDPNILQRFFAKKISIGQIIRIFLSIQIGEFPDITKWRVINFPGTVLREWFSIYSTRGC